MKCVLNGINVFIICVENCILRIYVYIKKFGSKVYNFVIIDFM